MCLARNYTTHWHTRPEKNKVIWLRPSVGETCPCTSVQHGATETVSTYLTLNLLTTTIVAPPSNASKWQMGFNSAFKGLNAFVCSAIFGRVCHCKISAKCGCSVTTAQEVPPTATSKSGQRRQTAFEMWWHKRRNQISSFAETDGSILNRRGRQFSRLLAAEVCASALVMLDTPRSEVVWRVLATHSIRQFPLHFPSCALPCAIRFQTHSTNGERVYHGLTVLPAIQWKMIISAKIYGRFLVMYSYGGQYLFQFEGYLA
jgi:hypothetical protein